MPDTAPDRTTNLIWIDLEMTGLCTQTDSVIEIATIVTDKYLSELAVGPVLAIEQSAATMDGMDEWNTRQHGKSGLTARVIESGNSAADATGCHRLSEMQGARSMLCFPAEIVAVVWIAAPVNLANFANILGDNTFNWLNFTHVAA